MSLNAPSSIQRGKSKLAGFGQKTVSAAGTAEKLTTTKTKDVLIKALSTNTGLVYVGDSTVSASNGYQLSAKEEILLPLDASKIYIDSAVNGEGVCFLGWH